MEPVIRSLTLKGFRSIRAERIEFDNPTFLVGRNGSGKSNIVDAFAFLREAMRIPLESVLDLRSGLPAILHRSMNGELLSLGLRVELQKGSFCGSYSFEIVPLPDSGFEVIRELCRVDTGQQEYWFERKQDSFTSNLEGIAPPLNPQFLTLPLIGAHEAFSFVFKHLFYIDVYSIDVTELQNAQTATKNPHLDPRGRNTANVLRDLEEHAPKSLSRIGELLSAILPYEVQVRPRRENGKVALEFLQKEASGSLVFGASSMSDGTLRTLALLTSVFQRFIPSLLLIEEPEAQLHPGALGLVLDLIQIASRETQVIVTTHSPELLEDKQIQGHHLRVVTWEEGRTRASPIAEGAQRAIQEHLMGAGELFRSNALDIPPLRQSEDVALFQPLA